MTISDVNLRSGPDTAFEVVALLPGGTLATVIEVDDPVSPLWAHVLLEDGLEGWVSVELIEPAY